jgi:vacuolar iron transporter family protein
VRRDEGYGKAKLNMTPNNTARYRANYQNEIDSAALYRALAAAEENQRLAEVYTRLATTEQRHADMWAEQLRATGQPTPAARIGWRSHTLGWLARRFGPQFVLPTINAMEQVDSHSYDGQPEASAAALPADERSHARLLATIADGKGMEGGTIARIEGRHRASSGNALRAAVLGASDGLLSNLSLVMGVAGADLSNQNILITGVAGLLAGAFSMAMGEWISVQSSRELYERQIAIERDELATAPEEEQEELALIYQAKGLAPEQAQALAQRMIGDKDSALDTLVREELAIDPRELGGSSWEAAITSFVLFAVGAIMPVVAFFFLTGLAAVVASIAISAIGLFLIGAAITLVTGRSVLYSGMRQVIFGLSAAAITFGIGKLLGVSLGG